MNISKFALFTAIITCMFFLASLAFAHEQAIQSGFFESFFVILREGLEAILIIGAIIAYLTMANHHDKVKVVYLWSGLAVLASILTALALDQIFAATSAQLEILEGVTMLLAASVLLYVTNWLLGKMDSKKWGNYIKGKVQDALTNKNTFALGLVSFLAVYREGFETVLFYKALVISTPDSTGILIGFIAGIILLAGLFVAIIKIEKRLPLNIIFGLTSAILFLLSLKFSGKGVHELQEAGIISETAVDAVPKIGDLGLYPTVETLGLQLAILALGTYLFYAHFAAKKKDASASV